MVYFLLLILVMLASPAMLAGLIILAVQNSRKNQIIRSLQQENEMMRQELGRGAEQPKMMRPVAAQPVPENPVPGKPIPGKPVPETLVPDKPVPEKPMELRTAPVPVQPLQSKQKPPVPKAAVPLPKKTDTNWQGTAALVMGVVFVILAGTIFATTAWHLLPNVGKVALILAFSGIFFGASAIAQHKLHITGTSKAFYILGSVFLYVAALAVGFFGLLGPELTLWGRGRYLLLFAGIVMTEAALLLGLRKFREILYGGLCLFGITAAVMFLLASFHPGCIGFTAGMAVYGVLVVCLARVLKKQGAGKLPQSIAAAFPAFSLVNLWGISALVLLNLEWGALSGGVTLMMAGLHLYLGKMEEDGKTSIGAFALLLAAGILRIASPDGMDSYLYTGSLVLIILSAMSYMELLGSQVRKILRYAGLCMAAILLAGNTLSFLFRAEASLAGVICMGLLLLDATLLALEYRKHLIYSIYSVMLAAFINYLLLYLELDVIHFLFLSGMVFGGLFLGVRRFKTPFKTLAGDILFAAIVIVDAGVLWLFTLFCQYGIDMYLMAGGTVVMLTAMLAVWSREHKSVRYFLPVVPTVLPWMIVTVLDRQFGLKPHYELSLLICLLVLIVWDLLKKDRFCAGILVLGTWYGFIYYLLKDISLPFFPVLALYLAQKRRELPKNRRMVFGCGVCIYLIAGAYAAFAPYLDYEVTRQLTAAAVWGVMFLIWKKRGRDLSMDIFFQIGFTVLYLGVMGAFYWENTCVSLWYLVPIALLFAAVCLYSYTRGRLHLHFFASAFTMALPTVLRFKYNVPENQLYGAVMAAFVLTAAAARMKCPLIRFTGEHGRRLQADWYHILLITVLLPMTLAAPNDQWRTVYILLMAAYVIQYATVKPLVRGSVTLAEVICVLAFWIQPWIRWPDVLALEICLIPAVAVIWSHGKIWGAGRVVSNIQMVLYTMCLLSLAFDAYLTQRVADALILEGICLTVFIVSCVRKCRRFAAISGVIALAVVIYMTRGFWLSLSWWVYLLAAGIGLILFAAVSEMKKH